MIVVTGDDIIFRSNLAKTQAGIEMAKQQVNIHSQTHTHTSTHTYSKPPSRFKSGISLTHIKWCALDLSCMPTSKRCVFDASGCG